MNRRAFLVGLGGAAGYFASKGVSQLAQSSLTGVQTVARGLESLFRAGTAQAASVADVVLVETLDKLPENHYTLRNNKTGELHGQRYRGIFVYPTKDAAERALADAPPVYGSTYTVISTNVPIISDRMENLESKFSQNPFATADHYERMGDFIDSCNKQDKFLLTHMENSKASDLNRYEMMSPALSYTRAAMFSTSPDQVKRILEKSSRAYGTSPVMLKGGYLSIRQGEFSNSMYNTRFGVFRVVFNGKDIIVNGEKLSEQKKIGELGKMLVEFAVANSGKVDGKKFYGVPFQDLFDAVLYHLR